MGIIFWVVLIAAAVAAVKWLVQGGGPGSMRRARSLARERYARGEITREQYETIKNNLS